MSTLFSAPLRPLSLKVLASSIFVWLISAAPLTLANEKNSLFSKASEVLAAANAAQANILAPQGYSAGSKHYQAAEVLYAKRRPIHKVQKELDAAESDLRQAAKNAELARITFAAVLKARNDARGVDAQRLAGKEWQAAEEELITAATKMESGNLKRAKNIASDAEEIYRQAELIAIKRSYLDEARQLIQQAKKEKVSRYAPTTLKAAESLLASAEKELTDNRYDIDYPRSLAKQARYEAKHALYLASQIKQLNRNKATKEEMLLNAEKPLIDIATALDIVAAFDEGPKIVTTGLVANIESLRADAYELGERKKELVSLENAMSSLEKRVGIQSERLAKQEEQKAKLRQVINLFNRNEATVLTEGQNILIRAVGLSFKPGSSQINSSNFALLKKLEQAIGIYSKYSVLIEGHTDSFGSDSVNLNLSFARAEAVKQYMDANMDQPVTIEAVGYGETRPIANNETSEGRARNRRIDLVLRPPL